MNIFDEENNKVQSEELHQIEIDFKKFFENNFAIGVMIGKIIFNENKKPYNFKILKINPGFERLTGLRRENIVDKIGFEIFPENIVLQLIDSLEKIITTGNNKELELCIKSIKKCFLINFVIPQEEVFIAIFTDITEIKSKQNKLNKIHQLQKAMNSVRAALLEINDESVLYQRICNALVQVDFIKIAGVWLFQNGNSNLNLAAISASNELMSYIDNNIDLHINPSKNTDIYIALETRQPIINNTTKDNVSSYFKNHISNLNIKSEIILPLICENQKYGVLGLYSDQEEIFNDSEEAFLLNGLSIDVAIGINTIRLRKRLQENNKNLNKAINDIINVLSRVVESRDPYTAGHQKRVAKLSVAIARKMGLSEDKVKMIELGALVHDIGKISVPIEILVKPGKITENEFNLIKEHPLTGYNLLKNLIYPLDMISQIALQHHERIDGSGYPQGLKGNKILLEARIVAVADVVESMCNHRPYRPALGIEKALEEISSKKGKLYDPKVVDACIKVFKEDGFNFD